VISRCPIIVRSRATLSADELDRRAAIYMELGVIYSEPGGCKESRGFRGAALRLGCAASALRHSAMSNYLENIEKANRHILSIFRNKIRCEGCDGSGIVEGIGNRGIRCPCLTEQDMEDVKKWLTEP
jgi:hypothetical protein